MALTRKRKGAVQASDTASQPATKKRWTGRMLNSGKNMKASAITQANSTESPLLALPPEIRNRIYEFILGAKTLHPRIFYERGPTNRLVRRVVVHVCRAETTDHDAAAVMRSTTTPTVCPTYFKRHASCMSTRGDSSSDDDKFETALLLTCRQVHSEAALIPFEANKFSSAKSYELRCFVRKLMNIQKRAIQSMVVADGGRICKDGVATALSGLTDMIIFFEYSIRDPVEFLRRVFPFRHFWGLKSATYCVLSRHQDDKGTGMSSCEEGVTRPDLFNTVCEELEAKLLGLAPADDGKGSSSNATNTKGGNRSSSKDAGKDSDRTEISTDKSSA